MFVFVLNARCGLSARKEVPVKINGESVHPYIYPKSAKQESTFTDENPSPNLPVAIFSDIFLLSPRRLRDSKSSSEKTELLWTSSEGPWYCLSAGSTRLSVP